MLWRKEPVASGHVRRTERLKLRGMPAACIRSRLTSGGTGLAVQYFLQLEMRDVEHGSGLVRVLRNVGFQVSRERIPSFALPEQRVLVHAALSRSVVSCATQRRSDRTRVGQRPATWRVLVALCSAFFLLRGSVVSCGGMQPPALPACFSPSIPNR